MTVVRCNRAEGSRLAIRKWKGNEDVTTEKGIYFN